MKTCDNDSWCRREYWCVFPSEINAEGEWEADLPLDERVARIIDLNEFRATAKICTALSAPPPPESERNAAPPTASEYDGRTDDLRGDIYYRGRGAGLSFQVPVDPENTGSYVGAEGPRWGAQVAGGEVTGAHAAICFVRSLELTESERDFDLNEDGDLEDTFDLGRIVYQGWSDDPAESIRINLTPSIILQEKGAYGTDMDDDGYEDPMFLWTPAQARLRMRFFVLAGTVNQREVVRRFETIIHLRNGAAE